MSIILESKKMKRTGLVPALLCGGIIAAAVPIINMAVRSEIYTGLDTSPIQILFDANWQMMAMLNILLIVAGACMIYHTEYADNAIQKLCTLPTRESSLYFGKFAFLTAMYAFVLIIEAAGIAISTYHWFELTGDIRIELLKSLGYSLLLMLPATLAALLIASACKNMWVSLGIGVVCVFLATLLPSDNFTLSLFPFSLPFQSFAGTAETTIRNFVIAAIAESIGFIIAELLFIKIRRSFE